LGIVRKHRAGSGLIHYDPRNEAQDWAQAAREAIAATRPQFIVMMLGLNDRQALRARPLTSASATSPGATAPPPLALVPQPGAAPQAERTSPAQPSIVTPEPPSQARSPLQTYEFRTEEWAEHYTRRIDATVAALKSAGVPVFWVGLPSLRGPKSTSDMLYLDDLFRSRAEKAGVTYIDVWDGFVDDNGRYVVQGPDFEGQIRRLRVSDGVHFTKAGARKLAHYVEREIRRVTTHGVGPIALPVSEAPVQVLSSQPGMPTARPLAGPVLPLTASATGVQDLLGGDSSSVNNPPAAVARVLVKGDAIAPPAGRSDDFKWPRRAIAPFGKDPVVATTTDPIPVMQAAPAATTVPVPRGESRSVAATGSKRTTGRAPSQNRRNSDRFPGIPFGQ
jgi:lysophospholipase L1-like esterase